MAEFEKLYTIRETMEILGRSKATILAYIHSGLLKARKFKPGSRTSKFVITETDLKAFINNELDENGKAPAGYYQVLYPRPHKSDSTN